MFIVFIYLLPCWVFAAAPRLLTVAASLTVGRTLGPVISAVVAPGLVALWYVESSRTGNRTHVPLLAGRFLAAWTTREVSLSDFRPI